MATTSWRFGLLVPLALTLGVAACDGRKAPRYQPVLKEKRQYEQPNPRYVPGYPHSEPPIFVIEEYVYGAFDTENGTVTSPSR
jgi:hypothetical protein